MEKESTYSYGDLYEDGYMYAEYDDGTASLIDSNGEYELRHRLNNPGFIKYDEHKGWIFKNGKALPWA